jgi:hypothetical protein
MKTVHALFGLMLVGAASTASSALAGPAEIVLAESEGASGTWTGGTTTGARAGDEMDRDSERGTTGMPSEPKGDVGASAGGSSGSRGSGSDPMAERPQPSATP